MKILMLNHNLRSKGTWNRAWQLARELARRGHAVTVWTAAPHHYYRPARERLDGVEILETPSWAPLAGADDGWGPLDTLYRSARILTEPHDLCYAFAHPPNVALPAWIATRLRRKPLLYDWCDWYEGGIFPKRREMREQGLIPSDERPTQQWTERRDMALEHRMPRLAGRVTVISEKLRELTLAEGRRPEDILLMPNGASLDTITPRDCTESRRRLSLPEGALYLGYIANYHPDEAYFLAAVARAAVTLPGLRLLAAGPPFTAELTRRLDLDGRIDHVGFVDQEKLGWVLGAADALALPLEDHPSNVARVPFKFTDYLASGRPIVTSRVGDMARWFDWRDEDGATIGEATGPTAEAFGDAMGRVLAPAADRDAMGRAARRLGEREFNWATLATRLETFITDWLESGPRTS